MLRTGEWRGMAVSKPLEAGFFDFDQLENALESSMGVEMKWQGVDSSQGNA